MRERIQSHRGTVLAAVIVAVNFAVALHVSGVSYGRYQWTAFAVSYGTPTATPTATATATHTPLPNGAGCTAPSQCASTFCVDGVCCNTICDQVNEFCNLRAAPGTCTVPRAAAPALDPVGLAVAILLLAGVGALAFRGRRRS